MKILAAVCVALALASASAKPGLRSKNKGVRRNAAWDAMSAEAKQAAIWASVTADETSWPWPSALDVGKILFESMDVTFDTVSDVMPAGREKLIHSEGYVMKFQWVPTSNSTFTGGFAGAQYGVARLSFAAEPTTSGIIPASAWKFLRSGVPSGDMVAMASLTPQPSFNFFEKIFTNHIGAPSDPGIIGDLIKWKFETASSCIRAIGCSNVAFFNEDGSSVGMDSFVSPFQFFLVPQVSFPDDSSNLKSWPELFGSIEPGTMLYEVHALMAPDSQPVIIAHIYTNSAIVPSMYGDTKLFFEHQRMDGPTGDMAYNPQWKSEGLDVDAMCDK